MRRGWWLGLLMLAGAAGAQVVEGGGRDVSVAMLSTRTLHAVTVTPLGERAWVARCERCAHAPLTAALHVLGTAEIFAGGTLRVTEDASGESRTAPGLWHLRASNGTVDVVLTLPSERYVAAVLNAEAAAGEPGQSLRALAIVARTYASNGDHYSAGVGHLSAELCDSTQCQAMMPGPVSAAIEDAVRDTAGETLWFGVRRAEVFFSQNCGGLTEDVGAVWPKLRGLAYLRSHADPYCARRDAAGWHAEVPLATFAEVARAEGWHVPVKIVAARVAERSASHRALRIVLTGGDGNELAVSASALRFGIGRALGWNRVRSDAYEVGVRNGALVFDGHGHGHGVGLCQAGATEMASEGKSAREILGFYFPGTTTRILAGDEGWQESRMGGVVVRGTGPVSAEQRVMVERTWGEAQKRFPPHRPMVPHLVYAPTTEIFRQMTTQPGWALASTQGETIVLQPETVLKAHGRHAAGTLLHEMLHVLVEAEATERAPLWLREGLVEVLAGETGAGARAMSVDAMESGLRHAESLQESERAHSSAAARVHALITRYGASAVRGWLSTGVPAGVA